jgi:hypothetical protein
MKTVLVMLFAFTMAGQVQAQTAPAPRHLPRGTALDITNAEILATVAKTASAAASDQQIRVMSINGEYNVGIAVGHRLKTEGEVGFGGEHSQITEIFHVISGNGTLVTGGTIENLRDNAADSPAVTIVGPSTGGASFIRPAWTTLAIPANASFLRLFSPLRRTVCRVLDTRRSGMHDAVLQVRGLLDVEPTEADQND